MRMGRVAPLVLLVCLLALPPGIAGAGEPAPATAWRVGLQVGHLRIEELPEDQARLRGQVGGSGGGYREVEVNEAIARRAAAILTARGVAVDILPAAVPPGYRADAFVAIHCDANANAGLRGYKLARYRESLIPERDDALIAALGDAYDAAIGLPRDPGVSWNMTGYYAYNAKRYTSIIDRQTPSAIFELGFLTHPADRATLIGRQDAIALALADGIMRFLEGTPATALDTTPSPPSPITATAATGYEGGGQAHEETRRRAWRNRLEP